MNCFRRICASACWRWCPAFWGVASLLGPGIGGLFASAGFWRGAFWINVPIVLLFILACTRLPKKKPSQTAIRFPYLQLALLTAGVAAVAMASQVAHLWAQVGLLVAAALAVALTIKLDQTSDNRMFPSHPLSLARPIGTANWVMALSSVTHSVIGAYLPLSMQILHGASDEAAGYAVTGLALSWTIASMMTSHIHGQMAMRSIVIGQSLCLIGLAGMALAITDLPFSVIVALNVVVGAGLGSSNLHLVEASMRHAPAGEQTTTAGAIPTIRSLGIAFGSAGAGVIANKAGLTDALLYDDVARATQWVLGIGALAPLFAIICATRFVRMVGAAAEGGRRGLALLADCRDLARHGEDLRHRRLGRVVGEAHDDAGALGRLALDLERAAVQLDNALHDRQAEAGAFVFAGELAVDLAERRQRDVHVLLVDADAGVADDELDAVVPRPAGERRRCRSPA